MTILEEQLINFAIGYIARGIDFGAYRETAGGDTVARRVLEQLKKAIETGRGKRNERS